MRGARHRPAPCAPIVAHAGSRRSALPGRRGSGRRARRLRRCRPGARPGCGVPGQHGPLAGDDRAAARRGCRHARRRSSRPAAFVWRQGRAFRLHAPRRARARGVQRIDWRHPATDARALPGVARVRRPEHELWTGGEREAAGAIERFWNTLDDTQPLSLLCACPLDSLDGRAYEGALQTVCNQHTRLLPAGDSQALDEAVSSAIREVLEPQLHGMLHALSTQHRPATQMPQGQAVMFWLRQHMPRTAERVLARVRARL